MYDLCRVVRHAGHNSNVGLQKVQLNGVLVYYHNCAFASFARVCIHQGCHAAGHGVAFKALVTPADDVACNIFCGKIVAIVPLYAFTHLQSVLCGIRIRLPAGQQHWLKGSVAVVLNKILKPTG